MIIFPCIIFSHWCPLRKSVRKTSLMSMMNDLPFRYFKWETRTFIFHRVINVCGRIMALQKCPCLHTRNLWMLHIKRYFADVIKEHEMVKLFCILWTGLYNHKGPYKRKGGGAELERGRGIRETQRLEWYKEGDTSQGRRGPSDTAEGKKTNSSPKLSEGMQPCWYLHLRTSDL